MTEFNRRSLLGLSALGLGATMLPSVTLGQAVAGKAPVMRIQRLEWAGLRIEAGETVAYIDAVAPESAVNIGKGAAKFVSPMKNRIGLITHEHGDHYDPVYLASLIGNDGTLICNRATADSMSWNSFRRKAVNLWEPVFLPRAGADMIAVAAPASDGFGVAQSCWIIKNSKHRIIHCGDTLWHGYFSDIGALFGPFDVAFLPINGARQNIGRFKDYEVPMALTPEQAVAAARALGAQKLIPIHYGSPNPPTYIEIDRPEERLIAEAQRRGVTVERLDVGAWMTLN
jgi:L-ascorbate metabolism protein UlaG (beta-lactamase superfamily)